MTAAATLHTASGVRETLLRRLAHRDVLVCGIVNVTPDSFSDGGRYLDPGRAVDHALALVAQGADLLDVGGESTRPGADPVAVTEELDRVLVVIDAVTGATSVPVSIDTSRPEVMRKAVAAGAVMINDVRALRLPGAVDAAAALEVPVCLMHMQGDPSTMQIAPHYTDVYTDVRNFLLERIGACRAAGIPMDHLVLDPGFGFGKTLAHNVELLAVLPRIAQMGLPVMAGLSRKGMLGAITGRDVPDRGAASVTAAVLAAQRGATVLRVHDVAATVDAMAMLHAVDATSD
jgi:dihydropteroate synthase